MHMYAGCHCDRKADNFPLEDSRPESKGKFTRTLSNRKVKFYVGNFALSLPHRVLTDCGKQRSFAEAGSTHQRAAKVMAQDTIVRLERDNQAIQKAHAATEAKLNGLQQP